MKSDEVMNELKFYQIFIKLRLMFFRIQEKKVKEQLIAHGKRIYDLHQQLVTVLEKMCQLEENVSKTKQEYDDLCNTSSDNDISPEELFTKRRKLKEWRDMYKVGL